MCCRSTREKCVECGTTCVDVPFLANEKITVQDDGAWQLRGRQILFTRLTLSASNECDVAKRNSAESSHSLVVASRMHGFLRSWPTCIAIIVAEYMYVKITKYRKSRMAKKNEIGQSSTYSRCFNRCVENVPTMCANPNPLQNAQMKDRATRTSGWSEL
eukprot:6214509-Pleurochrysis_carterae.AAC.12